MGKLRWRCPVERGLGINRANVESDKFCNAKVQLFDVPLSSLLSAGISPNRMSSKLRISAAYFSNVDCWMPPTGSNKIRT